MLNGNRAEVENVDFVSELRLRRWARANYVPPKQRSGTWHRVVLEEMCSKDAELDAQARNCAVSSSYVPLAPTTFHTRHDGHADQSDPNLLREIERFEIYVHG